MFNQKKSSLMLQLDLDDSVLAGPWEEIFISLWTLIRTHLTSRTMKVSRHCGPSGPGCCALLTQRPPDTALQWAVRSEVTLTKFLFFLNWNVNQKRSSWHHQSSAREGFNWMTRFALASSQSSLLCVTWSHGNGILPTSLSMRSVSPAQPFNKLLDQSSGDEKRSGRWRSHWVINHRIHSNRSDWAPGEDTCNNCSNDPEM